MSLLMVTAQCARCGRGFIGGSTPTDEFGLKSVKGYPTCGGTKEAIVPVPIDEFVEYHQWNRLTPSPP